MDTKFKIELYKKRVFIKGITKKRKVCTTNLKPWINKCANRTYIAYRRQLTKAEKKLSSVLLEVGKVLAVTLTTREEMTTKELNKHFSKLVEALRRVDSSTAFIKVLDAFKRGKRFHLHIVFQFPNGIPKYKGKEINKAWFVKHWKWANASSIDVKRCYKPHGWLEYMLNPKKENVIDVKVDGYTRIVTFSKNLVFEKPVEVFECSKEEIFDLVNYYVEKLGLVNGSGVFKKAVYSKWTDEKGKEHLNLEYCHIHP